MTTPEQSLEVFKVKPLKSGTGYYVVYSYDGLEKHISGFRTEDEAEGWIVHKSVDWLKKLRLEQ